MIMGRAEVPPGQSGRNGRAGLCQTRVRHWLAAPGETTPLS